MTILARATVILGADITALNRALSQAEQNVVDAGKRIGDAGRTLTMRVTLPLAAAAVVAFKEFGEQVDAMERVRAVIAATGGVAGVTADHIEVLGNRLEETTTFADNVTQSAAALLLMFKNVRNAAGAGNDVFDRTVKLAMDLSATLGDDLAGSMLLLGRALEDPGEGLMMLQRRTRAFSDEQQAMIKRLMDAGRTLEAQKRVLDVLGGLFGSVSEKMAKTPLGQFKQMWNELGNAMEEVGKVTAPVFEAIINFTKKAANWFQRLSDDTKLLIVVVGGLAAAAGPMLVMLGLGLKVLVMLPIAVSLLANAIGPLIVSFKLASASAALFTIGTTSLLAPIALVIAALASLVLAGMAIAAHWVWLKQQTLALWTFIKDQFFMGVDKVLEIVQTLIVNLHKLGTGMSMLPGLAGIAGRGLVIAMEEAAIATAVTRMAVQALAKESLEVAGGALARLEAAIMGVTTAAAGGGAAGGKDPPAWMAKLAEIAAKLTDELDLVRRMELALGDAFDESAARIKAFGGAIEDAIKNKVPLANAQLQLWIATLKGATRAAEELAFGLQLNLEIAVTRITEAITRAKAPLAEYNRQVALLQEQLFAGALTWEQYVARVEAARAAFDSTASAARDLGAEIRQGLVDTAGRAIDDFVDAMFDMSKNLGETIRQMILDLVKLIIKLELMRALFPSLFKGADVVSRQHGGFVAPGQMALVGEAGPELVRGGRSGMTVTPMPAMRAVPAGGLAGGITVPVTLNVAAMDSRDVTRFFEENEGAVVGVVTRAVSRSIVLRRLLGR